MNQHAPDVKPEEELESMKELLSVSTSLDWIDRILQEDVADWNAIAYQYRNIQKDIDSIDYDDVVNIGALGLIASDLFRADEGETPLTEL